MKETGKPMKVALIPVVEIFNVSEQFPSPANGPYWMYADEWEVWGRQSNVHAGFSETMVPYQKGGTLYTLDSLLDEDIWRIVQKELARYEPDDEEDTREEDIQLGAFNGGYVLRVNEQDIYFPQCCGDLSDIGAWESLLEEEQIHFCTGHPSPHVVRNRSKICFDFRHPSINERFVPPVLVATVEIEQEDLQTAIQQATQALVAFMKRLAAIAADRQLPAQYIAMWLVDERNTNARQSHFDTE